MNEFDDYLISTEPGEHHDLCVRWSGDNRILYISTNHRTMGMSPKMAEELLRALLATLKGGFARAISEVALRREQAERNYRESRPPSEPPITNPRPELDQL